MNALIGFLSVLLVSITVAAAQTSNVGREEQILFFPGIGHQIAGSDDWELNVTGCVYENEKRRAALALLRKSLGWNRTDLSEDENAMFEKRAGLFLVDNERGKSVVIRIGAQSYRMNKSESNGRFSGVVRLSNAAVQKLNGSGNPPSFIRFHAILPKRDLRTFGGEIALIRNSGVVVVSDIDDTIKVSDVRNRRALLRNTFLNPFKPASGMAGLYCSWTNADVQFYYVSASPWQLYEPLSGFVRSNGFPAGVFLLRDFRWKDKTVLSLFNDPEAYKVNRIQALLKQFPGRQFVLVGDSGERDPEAYAALAGDHPGQVRKILIRDVTDETPSAERYKRLLEKLPPGVLEVFRDPSEVTEALPQFK
jgi:hypothetical protein